MRMRIDYRRERWLSPVTPWVHAGVGASLWSATEFDPPMPRSLPGKGYPCWVLEHRGRELVFASPEEIAHAIDILGRRILPSPRDLGEAHGAVNAHWLSRLHTSFKPWKVRQELVMELKKAPAADAR
jgi:hypothetical protein